VSVALIVKDANAKASLVPLATEATYASIWQSGAKAHALEWVAAMQGGVNVTEENREEILSELGTLRGWFDTNGHEAQSTRVDLVVKALERLRFGAGETAWIG
jgi:hypothetical protein